MSFFMCFKKLTLWPIRLSNVDRTVSLFASILLWLCYSFSVYRFDIKVTIPRGPLFQNWLAPKIFSKKKLHLYFYFLVLQVATVATWFYLGCNISQPAKKKTSMEGSFQRGLLPFLSSPLPPFFLCQITLFFFFNHNPNPLILPLLMYLLLKSKRSNSAGGNNTNQGNQGEIGDQGHPFFFSLCALDFRGCHSGNISKIFT